MPCLHSFHFRVKALPRYRSQSRISNLIVQCYVLQETERTSWKNTENTGQETRHI
jgi:hypothetical protein